MDAKIKFSTYKEPINGEIIIPNSPTKQLTVKVPTSIEYNSKDLSGKSVKATIKVAKIKIKATKFDLVQETDNTIVLTCNWSKE